MSTPSPFDRSVLDIDCAAEAERIAAALRWLTSRQLRRRGLVLGVSGGIDSSVCAALAVRAVGAERVVGLLMPERDSAGDTTDLGLRVCDNLGIEAVIEDISPALEALGCYQRRDDAIRRLFPDFGPSHRCKIALADGLLTTERLNYFNLVVAGSDGVQHKKRMPVDVYLQVVAATNMKQRTRKLIEYYHAEARNYAVLGTPNRQEFELGFFVRGGDGLADLKPIAHLYKTQVYALADHLGLPEVVCAQPPTTDTYSLPQSQEEFYFAVGYEDMGVLLFAYEHDVAPADAAAALGIDARAAQRVYQDIEGKRRTARQLDQKPLRIDDARE